MLTLNMMTGRSRIATLASSAGIGGPPLSLRRTKKGAASTAFSASASAAPPQVSLFLFLLGFCGEIRERESAEEWVRERRQI